MVKVKFILYIFLAFIVIIIALLYIPGGGFAHKILYSGIPTDKDSILLFAHRGILKYFPENSEQGFIEARNLGFKAVEIDIRKTKDGHFILMHDTNCTRLLGIDKLVSDMTLKEIKRYPVIFNNKKTGNFILSLEEFITKFKSDFIIYLDMKSGKDEYTIQLADDIAEFIEKHNLFGSAIVACADFFFIAYLEYEYPGIMTAMEGFHSGKEWVYCLIPYNFKPDFLSSSFRKVDKEHTHWLEKNGLLPNRIVYHVNSKNLDDMLNCKIKNIIFDYDSTSYNKIKFFLSNKRIVAE